MASTTRVDTTAYPRPATKYVMSLAMTTRPHRGVVRNVGVAVRCRNSWVIPMMDRMTTKITAAVAAENTIGWMFGLSRGGSPDSGLLAKPRVRLVKRAAIAAAPISSHSHTFVEKSLRNSERTNALTRRSPGHPRRTAPHRR